ncbi:TPA: recombinase family protein [Bacillus cereus]
MKFGYMRVSTIDQNLDRQKRQLEKFGCERIFFEKVTGTKRERPELNRMLEFLRPEDTVVVSDLTRLSRSTKDLIEITELIAQKGAHLKSLKESWLDTTTAHGKMLFTIFAGIAQFERDLTSERTKEGILAAKKRGKYPGRPKGVFLPIPPKRWNKEYLTERLGKYSLNIAYSVSDITFNWANS